MVKAPRPDKTYPATVVADDGTRVTVRAPWAGAARDFGFVRFEPGDVLTEHFWRDRWYAVKEVRAADGALKGWYCDVTRPARVLDGGTAPAAGGAGRGGGRAGSGGSAGPGARATLLVADLDLDLWCSADGRAVLRLDEDEFAESGLTGRDPGAAARALASLDELERLAHGEGLGVLTG
ncbi:DUF402 domain-containing protein [Streptomyces zingiberis]|uniref:DUF402 domain-containing protein n=1 Tax=Streptomyces zingiberis TaxID=2053010 RepID=UPI001F0DCEBF|nr:DUF402 domain-containing protein [Streptomyces zingiberis]